MKITAVLSLFFLPSILLAQDTIPSGTVLPVRLNGSISSHKSKAGQRITGRVMQDVPLGNGKNIHAGATLRGQIINVNRASANTPGSVSIRFDRLEFAGRSIPVRVRLRAMASILEIDSAQIAMYGGDRGTPSSTFETTQVGGEVVYRGGGHVMRGEEVAGEPVPNGVLSPVRPNPEGNCRGAIDGNDRPQALWLFSSAACGVYGYHDVVIDHAGRTHPVGEIVLSAPKADVLIRSGSGMLLRVLGPAAAPPKTT